MSDKAEDWYEYRIEGHWTPLHQAALSGDTTAVETLVTKGAQDVDAKNWDGGTPLLVAAQEGHLLMVLELLKAKADVNSTTIQQATPLFKAVESGHEDVVRALLKANADVNINIKNGGIPLVKACISDNLEIVKMLIAAKSDVNSCCEGEVTPLYAAAFHGRLQNVQELIKANAIIDSRKSNGATPLFVASQQGHPDVVNALIKAGADVNACVNDGITPLFVATQQGKEEIVKILLTAKADVHAHHQDGATPLYCAAFHGHVTILKILLEAHSDIEAKYLGATPLYTAADEGHEDVVRILLAAKANVKAKLESGETPLYVAAFKGHNGVVRMLLEANADLEAKHSNGSSPLNVAVNRHHLDVVATLISFKADLESKDKHGWTPLHGAAHDGHVALVSMLLRHGANVNSISFDGVTPLQAAAMNNKVEVIKLLIQHKAEIRTTDHLGRSAMAMAKDVSAMKVIWNESKDQDKAFLLRQVSTFIHRNSVSFIGDQFRQSKIHVLLQVINGVTIFGMLCDKFPEVAARVLKQHSDLAKESFINAGHPSPLWLSVNRGHTSLVNALVQETVCTLDCKAPDGSTPLLLALVRNNSEIVNIFQRKMHPDTIIQTQLMLGIKPRNPTLATVEYAVWADNVSFIRDLKLPIQLREKLEQKVKNRIGKAENAFMQVSKQYPYQNEQDEELEELDKIRDECTKSKALNFKLLKKLFLKDFCTIAASRQVMIGDKMEMDQIDTNLDCLSTCEQIANCNVIKRVIRVCQLIEVGLKSSERFGPLRPQLMLVGSGAEGTRLGKASELDSRLYFRALDQHPFTLPKSATSIETDPTILLLEPYKKAGGVFNYAKFFHHLMDEVWKALTGAVERDESGSYVEGFEIRPHSPCPQCKALKTEASDPHTHCLDCKPTLTHTKIGPCLQLVDAKSKEFITVDMAPVFPIKDITKIQLFRAVTSSLLQEKPVGWSNHLKKFIAKDCLPSDAMDEAQPDDGQCQEVYFVNVKILNYTVKSGSNHIVHPGQGMGMIELFDKHSQLKLAYKYLKATKLVLNVDVPSYTIKKILHSLFKSYNDPSWMAWQVFYYDVMTDPEMKRRFRLKINYHNWREGYYKIPL